ncbi:hypothetical protein GGU10DRAFT_413012 [Lentinula aff. detonsa]|uniref:RNI-like protein n=1 Tax=Lentinula aff. detonsa TaxID=2804958 RepID=A0AA38L360_9AGAR|nr:hypothetical protein GGU10DRAFT_413012 [Lentinula aff. detonsa]
MNDLKMLSVLAYVIASELQDRSDGASKSTYQPQSGRHTRTSTRPRLECHSRKTATDTHLGDAGAITLAEWMGEYRGLRWLDLTRNSRSNPDPSSGGRETAQMGANGAGEGLGEAGVLALAQGVKVNTTLRCLDVEVPTGVEGYASYQQRRSIHVIAMSKPMQDSTQDSEICPMNGNHD